MVRTILDKKSRAKSQR